MLEQINEKEYLIFYADDDLLEAEPDQPKVYRADGLILETVETIDACEFESDEENEERNEDVEENVV